MIRIGWLVALTLAAGTTAAAQDLDCAEPDLTMVCTTPARTYQDQFCRVVHTIAGDSSRRSIAKQACIEVQVDVTGRNLKAFLLYAQARSKAIDVSTIESVRTDKQIGAPGNGAGSGSAVSKGSVPAILGFAVENGALTQETGDTTVTLRGNLVGWLDLIQNQGFIDAYQDDSWIVRQLRRVSYSLTLNTDSTAAAASGSGLSPNALLDQVRQAKQQLAGISGRIAIVDQRDPRTLDNRLALTTLLGRQMDAALEADDFLDAVFNDKTYYDQGWVKETAALLADPSLGAAGVERVFYRRLEVLRLYMRDHIDNFDERVTRAIMALDGFDKARLKVFQAMQKKPLLALEYLNARDKQLPDTHTLRFIYERQVGPRIDLTANASSTLQRSGTSPTGATILDGVRDIQVAVQLDVPLASAAKTLSSSGGIGTPVVSVAYLFEQLKETAAIKFAGNTFSAEAGDIHLVQAKLTIPMKGSGMKIPLSLSYSNRTDLIREKTVRAHVGITFDLDVLTALRP